MIKFKQSNRGGIIKMVIFGVIILLVLAYFGFNLRGMVASETFQDNWKYISEIAMGIWNNYLSGPFGYLWSKLIVPSLQKI